MFGQVRWIVRASVLLVLSGGALGVTVAGAQPSATRVVVTLSEYQIQLSRSTVAPGRVTFDVRNRGTVAHDFAIASIGTGTRALRPGERQSLAVRLQRKGVHRVSSRLAGDVALGMRGAIRVGKGAPLPRRYGSSAPPVVLTPVVSGQGSITHIAAPPGDVRRLMLVHRSGYVSLLKDGSAQSEPFLDLRGRVRVGFENGMHSIAFAPDYETSGRFYVTFNDLTANLYLAEFRRSDTNHDVADLFSERQLLEIVKPTEIHNGGMLQFGPDGYLYMAVGDGGSDPPRTPIGRPAQALSDPLGSILRIDPSGGDPYGIPDGNVFRDAEDALSEIVAYGLRNPWRFWIDATTNRMLIADVGERAREEVNVLKLDELGANFGWPCREGTVVPDFAPEECSDASFTPPIYEYERSRPGCAIIGGVVARDARLPSLDGLYVWSDYCNGNLMVIHPNAAMPRALPLKRSVLRPASFGVDGTGRIYVTTVEGDVFRLDPRPWPTARIRSSSVRSSQSTSLTNGWPFRSS